VPTTIAVGDTVKASWSSSVAASVGDWVGLVQGTSGGAVLWHKSYEGNGVFSDSFDTEWTPTTGATYKFIFVRKGTIAGMSARMTATVM